MATARRFYFYGLCFVSGLMVFIGALILADALLDGGASFDTQNVAQSIAMILVGLPVYAIHWWLAERSVRAGTDERNAALRKAYFYGMLAVSTAAGLIAFHSLLSRVVGASTNISLASAIAILVIAVAAWTYHLRLVRSDARLQPESGLAATVRRWYQYGLAAIGLALAWWAASDLFANILAALQRGDSILWPDRTRQSGALFCTALAAWTPAWAVIQRRARGDDDEQGSSLRKLYLFGFVIAASAMTLTLLAIWLDWVFQFLLAVPSPGRYRLDPDAASAFAGWTLSALLWLYHNRTLNADERRKQMPGAAMVRRAIRYGWAAVGLGFAALAAHQLLAIGIAAIADASTFAARRRDASEFLAQFLAGLVAWLPAWSVLQRRLPADEDDRRGLLRKLYLYSASFAGALAALFNLAMWFQSVLLVVFGDRLPAAEVLVAGTASTLAAALVGTAVWAYHRRVIVSDARSGERPLQAGVRRLYDYVFAAISLTVLLIGVAVTGETVLNMALGWSTDPGKGEAWWREPLAWGIAALAAALPVWVLVWRRIQSAARREDDEGMTERRAVTRRFYLYGVALAGAIVVLSNLAAAIYQSIRAFLSPGSDILAGNILAALIRALVTGVAWGYHLAIIRRESVRVAAAGPAPAIAVAAGPFAEAFRSELARVLPAARLVVAETPEGWRGADIAIVPASHLGAESFQLPPMRDGAARILIVPDGDAHVRVLNAPTNPSTAEMARQAAYWLEREYTKS